MRPSTLLRSTRMLLVLSLVVVARGAAAQPTVFTTAPPGTQPQMPVPGGRGGGQQSAADLPPGTAVLRGRVFAADTGQPLRKAQVRIVQMPEASQAGVMAFRDNKLATTNERGIYEFKELRAGRYQLTASKGSYVSLSYGQTRPTEPGKPIQVLDAQTIERVDFSLPHGAVITGRILDEYGEPMPDVSVGPQRYQYTQGQRRLVPAGRMAFTNDLGEFRLFGIPPGQYYLQATWRAQNPMGAGTPTGPSVGYAPMFFPGTLDVAQAQRLTIGVGVEMSDVVMTMRPVKTARVTGSVLDSQGRPMRAMLFVMQDSGAFGVTSGASVQPDGTFTLNSVAPGEYVLRAAQMTNPADAESGTIRLTVGSDDISGVQITASRAVYARGHVVVDPAAAASLPQRLLVILSPVQFMPMMGTMPGAVLDDMSFELKGSPGKYRINLGATGWTVRSVRWNASDVTDSGFEIKPNEDLAGLEVEITNRLTTISGLVTNARGEQLKDYSTVVFAQDPTRWGGTTRYQSVGRPDQDGRFKITGLPAGDYYIIALDRVDAGETGDPEFLERIRTRASTISLNEGETKTVDLRMQTAER